MSKKSPGTNQNLISTDQLIAQAKAQGVKFGFGDPKNRIRYFIKSGLLPKQIRRYENNEYVAYIPSEALELLVKIYSLTSAGIKVSNIIKNNLIVVTPNSPENTEQVLEQVEVQKKEEPIVEIPTTVEIPKEQPVQSVIVVEKPDVLVLEDAPVIEQPLESEELTEEIYAAAVVQPELEVRADSVEIVADEKINEKAFISRAFLYAYTLTLLFFILGSSYLYTTNPNHKSFFSDFSDNLSAYIGADNSDSEVLSYAVDESSRAASVIDSSTELLALSKEIEDIKTQYQAYDYWSAQIDGDYFGNIDDKDSIDFIPGRDIDFSYKKNESIKVSLEDKLDDIRRISFIGGPSIAASSGDLLIDADNFTVSADKGIELNGESLEDIIGDRQYTNNYYLTDSQSITASLETIDIALNSVISGGTGVWTLSSGLISPDASADGVLLPVGTTAERPGSPVSGIIRFNSSTSQFEGYGGSAWGSLGGIKDTDQDTYISAENNPGDDNDQLRFFTAGVERATIGSTGTFGINGIVNLSGVIAGDASNAFVLALDAGDNVELLDLSAYDTNASDDLTTATSFSGDVSGVYNNLQLGTGVVGSLELASTSVSAGTYGDMTNIPTIIVDADGRITSISNNSISYDNYGSWIYQIDGVSQDAVTTGTTFNIAAGNDIDIADTGTRSLTFNLESTLDIVSTINLAGTGTLNGLDAIDLTSENTLESTLDIAGDVTGTGLSTVTVAKINGVDLGTTTATSANILVADGDSWESVALSGDITIDSLGVSTIGANKVALGDDTTGNYLATLADAGNGFFTVSGSGSETAAVTLDIADDSIGFGQLADALALDASTDIAVDNAEVFSITNTGTSYSFRVNDESSDASPFVIASDGLVGIGTTDPQRVLHMRDTNAAFRMDRGDSLSGPFAIFAQYTDGTYSTVNQSWAFGSPLSTNFVISDLGTAVSGGGTVRFTVESSTGDVGVGTTAPSARLHSLSTSEQLRLAYDGSNYASFTTSSGGDLTLAPSGSDFALTGNFDVSGTFTSGTADAFTIDASGAITAATGITSSGTINFSGLTASSAVYTDASKNLTSTPPTSGTLGYWDRTGTTLSPSNAGDAITTTGNISTTSTGTITSAGLLTGSAGLTISGGAANINASGTNLTNIGNSTGVLTLASGGASGWTNTSGNLTLATATSGDIILSPFGNVGIGTTAPDSKLALSGADVVLNLENTSASAGSGGVLRFGHNQSSSTLPIAELRAELTNGAGASNRAGDLSFWTSNAGVLAERIRILAAGNVGIGTTAPGGLLHLAKDSNAEQFIIERTSVGATSKWGIKLQGTVTPDFKLVDMLSSTIPFTIEKAAPTNSLYIQATTGNVGIGTTAPASLINATANKVLDITASGIGGLTIHNGSGTELALVGSGAGYYLDIAGDSTASDNFFAVRTSNSVSSYSISEKFRITSAGNVGIGTTAPNRILDIRSASNPGWLVANTGGKATGLYSGTSGTALDYDDSGFFGIYSKSNANIIAGNSSGGTARLLIDSTGNVGIGTTAPNKLLELSKANDTTVRLTATQNDALWVDGNVLGGFEVYSSDTSGAIGAGVKSSVKVISLGNAEFGGYTGLKFSTSGLDGNEVERLRITNGGNVGIGTTAPTEILDVSGDVYVAGSGSSIGGTTLSNASLKVGSSFGIDSNELYFDGVDGAIGVISAHNLLLRTNGATRMTVHSGGNVGIGTTAPGANLDIGGSAAIDGTSPISTFISSLNNSSSWTVDAAISRLGFYSGDTSGGGAGIRSSVEMFTENTAGSTYGLRFKTDGGSLSEKLRITSAGNVGIGTTAPTSMFSVGSSSQFQVNSSGAIAAATGITSSGTINFSGLTASTGVYTDASKNLTSTPPTSGTLGYWSRSGTTISTATAGDNISTSGQIFTNTGATQGTGLVIGKSTDTSGSATLEIYNSQPTIRQELARPTGGYAYSFFDAHATNTSTALTTNIGQIGALGDLQSGVTAPTLTYLFLSSIASPAYNNANMFLHDTGNISMGTGNISDNAALNIQGTTTDSTAIALNVTNSSDGSLLYVRNDGNVGIGITAPGAKLDVLTTTEALRLSYDASNYASFTTSSTGNLTVGTTGTTLILGNGTSGTVLNIHGKSGTSNTLVVENSTDANPDITLSSASDRYLNITNTGAGLFGLTVEGNVGIGTTAPGAMLEVYGSTASKQIKVSGNNAGIFTDFNFNVDIDNDNNSTDRTFSVSSNNLGNYHFVVQEDGVVKIGGTSATTIPNMLLTAAGLVGIGTTAPLEQLSVHDGYLRLTNTTGEAAYTGTYITNTTGNSEYLQATGGKPTYSSGYKITPLGTAAVMQLNNANTFNWYTPTGLTAGALSATLTPDMVFKAGQLGIGTTSPSSKLHVAGSSGAVVIIERTDSTQGNGGMAFLGSDLVTDAAIYYNNLVSGALSFHTGGGAVGNTRMTIDSAGLVGIGTTAPSQKLEVAGGHIQIDNATALKTKNSSGTVRNLIYMDATNILHVAGEAGDAINISSAGLVGIGTTAPTASLDVSQGTMALIIGADSGATTRTNATTKVARFGVPHYTNAEEPLGLITAQSLVSSSDVFIGGGSSLFNAATNIQFYTGATNTTTTGTARMTINSSGNVGVGTTNPAEKLDVGGDARISGSGASIGLADIANAYLIVGADSAGIGIDSNEIMIEGDNLNLGSITSHELRIHTAGSQKMVVSSGGNVGIGITNPAGKFDVADTSNAAASLTLTNNTVTTLGAGINTTGVLDLQSTSLTTGNFMNIELNALSTGKGINLTSTSTALTTGNLFFNGYWNPGSTATATGDLFKLDVGANALVTGNLFALYNNGSSLFSVGTAKITSSVPHEFTAAGDVSFAYDAIFTNQTASQIEAYGPLTIISGESFENLDLTLKAYGTGAVVVDNSDVELYSGQKLILDTNDSGDSYFAHNNGSNYVSAYADGVEVLRFNSDQTVDGNSTFDANAFDIAEYYPTTDSTVEAGDVVALASSSEEESTETVSSYLVAKADPSQTSSQVLGIISTKPGFSMGGGSFRSEFCSLVESGEAGEAQARKDTFESTIKESIIKGEFEIESLVGIDLSTDENLLLVNAVVAQLYEEYIEGSELSYAIPQTRLATIEDRINTCKAVKQVPVTLAGRVPVKVDTNNGNIKAGDLLAPSTFSIGKAMKAVNRGWVVGRALEDQKEGSDTVMVYVFTSWYDGGSTIATGPSINNSTQSLSLNENLASMLTITTGTNGRKNLGIVGDLTTTGDISSSVLTASNFLNVGLLRLDAFDNSINALGSKLYVQNQYGALDVDFFNGKLVIGTDGSLVSLDKIEAKEIAAQEFRVLGSNTADSSATVGEGLIESGQTEVIIENTYVKSNSKVFVTPTTKTANKTLVVEEKNDGSFKVAISGVYSEDIKFDYWIIQIQD